MSISKAIFICGPTAVGKTSVSIELAHHFQTEILSFDSRQFYKELKIGAAPPSRDELAAIKHHFIGHLSLTNGEELNAGKYEQEALAKLDTLFNTKKHVILVGGSGLYMRAVTHGLDPLPKANETLRATLNQELNTKGLDHLARELYKLDPVYAKQVDIKNPQRVMRALEVIHESGKPYSTLVNLAPKKRPFNIIKIGLDMDRDVLYKRINSRVDHMLKQGLEDEARALYSFKDLNALQTVGYKEWWPYFDANVSRQAVIDNIKQNSRRYAKRQLTWFRREKNIMWFKPNQLKEMIDEISQSE